MLCRPRGASHRRRRSSRSRKVATNSARFAWFPTRAARRFRGLSLILNAKRARLVAAGAREITLLGQNVNAYHGAGPRVGSATLADLIARLALIDGLQRMRYTTSHPNDMSDDLIAAHAEIPKLMPYLHLPVQSGSDRVLAAMNRKHAAADYLDVIAKVRAARPDIALSSDFIVGFPGETDDDAESTLQLVRTVGFAQSYSFKYSARPGLRPRGPKARSPDDVKTRRLAELQALLEAQQRDFNAASVGRTLPVLFERAGREPGVVVGRSPQMQLVHARGELRAHRRDCGCGHNRRSPDEPRRRVRRAGGGWRPECHASGMIGVYRNRRIKCPARRRPLSPFCRRGSLRRSRRQFVRARARMRRDG